VLQSHKAEVLGKLAKVALFWKITVSASWPLMDGLPLDCVSFLLSRLWLPQILKISLCNKWTRKNLFNAVTEITHPWDGPNDGNMCAFTAGTSSGAGQAHRSFADGLIGFRIFLSANYVYLTFVWRSKKVLKHWHKPPPVSLPTLPSWKSTVSLALIATLHHYFYQIVWNIMNLSPFSGSEVLSLSLHCSASLDWLLY